jgi:fructosamine-3-kinase
LIHEKPGSPTIAGDFHLDGNVINSFAPGTKVLCAQKFGQSKWTITARVDVVHPDSTAASYFLKCAAGEAGRVMVEGEFHSMSALYQTMPELVPRPHSWGEFSTSSPEMYFILIEFMDMSDQMPEPDQLCSQLAKLHKLSQSPTGMFGFHITTCQGQSPQAVAWEPNWTIYFGNLLRHVIAMDDAENGLWPALTQLEERLLSRVVPYLLDNLTKDGRVVKPCLIHGDLWEGNTGTCYSTGKISLFDPAAMYAHNELEIGNWRCSYNKIHNEIYTRTYLRHFGPSEPREEWGDRNRLYCIYYNVLYSVNHQSDGEAVRQQ